MSTQPHYVTVQDYLAAEEQSSIRCEYWKGHIAAMAGGTPTHADIISNLHGIIKRQVRNTGCFVRSSDLRVRTASDGLYTYPDLVISCGSQYDGSTLINPVALIEVLSDATADYDRGRKFERYRSIASLQEYLCVAQDAIHVEQYIRQDHQWILSEYGIEDVFLLNRNIEIRVSDIYDDLETGLAPKA